MNYVSTNNYINHMNRITFNDFFMNYIVKLNVIDSNITETYLSFPRSRFYKEFIQEKNHNNYIFYILMKDFNCLNENCCDSILLSQTMNVNLVFILHLILHYEAATQITNSKYNGRAADLAAWSAIAFDVSEDVSSQVACGGICSSQRAIE